MAKVSPWDIRGYKAHVHTTNWQATVDLLHPQLGLIDVQLRGVLLTQCQLLQVKPPGNSGVLDYRESLEETYTRLDDLVVTYSESVERPVRPQIYWRVLRSDRILGGLELVVSAQTSLLRSAPQTTVTSRWNQGSAWRLLDANFELFEPVEAAAGDATELTPQDGSGLFLIRPQSPGISVALGLYPADFSRAVWGGQSSSHGNELTFCLFPDDLEKGVIRRSRVRCWFLPRHEDMSLACAEYLDFCQSPLPLTT